MKKKAADFLNVVKAHKQKVKEMHLINVKVSYNNYCVIQSIRKHRRIKPSVSAIVEEYTLKALNAVHDYEYAPQSYINKRVQIFVTEKQLKEIDDLSFEFGPFGISRSEAASWLLNIGLQKLNKEIVIVGFEEEIKKKGEDDEFDFSDVEIIQTY